MSITIIIIAITAIVSFAAFSNPILMNKLILYPAVMHNPEDYYRLITSGFIHADINHLLFNMFALYSFGEAIVGIGFGNIFLLLYLSGIVIASLPSFLKNRTNNYYRSLGASGGVSAIIFFSIYYSPWSQIGFMFIPVGIPSILFAILYLAYTVYMDKRGGGRVNHNAHLWGSLYGLFFAFCVDHTHGSYFMYTILHPSF